MRRALLLLLALPVLAACAPEEGDIIDKKYDPANTWYSTEPIYVTESYSCPKTTTVNGKSTTISGTCTRQVQRGSQQVQHYDPEDFRLKIRNGEDTGWVSVPEKTYYDRAEIGDYYDHGDVRDTQ